MNNRVLLGMSGGVDSSVAAHILLEQGFDVVGATMQLYDNEFLGNINPQTCSTSKTCCSLDDVEDARAVADILGIPHYTLDFRKEFKEYVVDPFANDYLLGKTPNPCIRCNKFLKFQFMRRRAQELGCDYIATGHYARIAECKNEQGTSFALLKGKDVSKDQSYVLYDFTQDDLAHTLLPLGDFTKAEVRQMATSLGFVNAEKPDSQDICFIPHGDTMAFVSSYTHTSKTPGIAYDTKGNHLGEHGGAYKYTIGQRKGIGIAYTEPLYVIDKDIEQNSLTLGTKDELLTNECLIQDWNWVSSNIPITFPIHVEVKTYYRQIPRGAQLFKNNDTTLTCVYDEPTKRGAPGQSFVAYRGNEVLGGGIIA